jgi:membrane glycosyltransferase
MGIATGWGPQVRDDRALPFGLVLRTYLPHTLIGLICAALLWRFLPAGFYWYVPLLAGLVLAVPLVALTSSLRLGEWAARRGLFCTPGEILKLPVLERTHRLLASRKQENRDFPRLVLEDAAVRDLHLRILRETDPAKTVMADVSPERLAALVTAAGRRDVAGFSRQDWIALLSDPESLTAAAALQG